MNAEQRAALVEELAEALYRGTLEGEGGIDDGHYQDEFYPYLDRFARSMANDVLPIIDRLLSDQEAAFAKALAEANSLVADAYEKGWNAAIAMGVIPDESWDNAEMVRFSDADEAERSRREIAEQEKNNARIVYDRMYGSRPDNVVTLDSAREKV